MSRHKFIVLNLRELKTPAIMLGVSICAFSAFLFLGQNNDNQTATAPVFASSTNYQDGTYIANLAFSDANMDLVVTIENEAIVSVSLYGFDSRPIFQHI